MLCEILQIGVNDGVAFRHHGGLKQDKINAKAIVDMSVAFYSGLVVINRQSMSLLWRQKLWLSNVRHNWLRLIFDKGTAMVILYYFCGICLAKSDCGGVKH